MAIILAFHLPASLKVDRSLTLDTSKPIRSADISQGFSDTPDLIGEIIPYY